MKNCTSCPRKCEINREKEAGLCRAMWEPMVASVMIHHWEERPISGFNGSGTIFFAGCNLHCVFCQNYDISQSANGKKMTTRELADCFMDLERRGVHNINLVSPSHFVPQIIEAIIYAKENGIKIPFLYNSGGYDSLSSIQLLDGLIDIYMPDLKYASNSPGQRYSNVPDYFDIASVAIKEMYKQVGAPEMHNTVMQRGLLIRHLVLPGFDNDSIAIMNWIKANTPLAGISLLKQYSPQYMAGKYNEINRRPTKDEYNTIITHIKSIGLSGNLV